MNVKGVRKCIARGQIKQALELMQDHSSYEDEVLGIVQRHNKLRVKIRQGLLSSSEETVAFNKITADILSLLREIENNKINIREQNNDMNNFQNSLDQLNKLKNKIRFGSFSEQLQQEYFFLVEKLKNFLSSRVVNNLFDVDGKLEASLKEKIQNFWNIHSLELLKENKVKVAKLMNLVELCAEEPTKGNVLNLANELWIYDKTLDYRERVKYVTGSTLGTQSLYQILEEIASEVDILWETVK